MTRGSDDRHSAGFFRVRTDAPPDLSPPERFHPGDEIGDFHLVRLLGSGGMGQVWEATQRSLQRQVALKLILPEVVDAHTIALLAREARAGGRLTHPAIVAVHAAGEAGGVHYIAQELVPGGTSLADILSEAEVEDTLGDAFFRDAARFMLTCAEALGAAHEAGVIHRDVKPHNILVTADGEPKIGDFGLARIAAEHSVSRSLELVGTYCYMSPEQAAAKTIGVDHRADIFSLGATFYELLTLSRPFEGDTEVQILERILYHDPPAPRQLRSRVPEDLALITMTCLEKRREERYASMADLAEDLRRFLADEPILARPPGPLRRARKWVRRHPTWSTATAVAAVALVAIGLQLDTSLKQQAELAAMNEDLVEANEDLDEAREAAETQAELAEARAEDIRRASYAANVRAAQAAIEQGQVVLALQYLEACPNHLRDWEWRYLNLQARPASRRWKAFEGEVEMLVPSPGGHLLATVGRNDPQKSTVVVRVWDPRAESMLGEASFSDSLQDLEFTRDGQGLVLIVDESTWSEDTPNAFLWNVFGQPVPIPTDPTLGPVIAAATEPGGTGLALAHSEGTVTTRRTPLGPVTNSAAAHADQALAWLADGHIIAASYTRSSVFEGPSLKLNRALGFTWGGYLSWDGTSAIDLVARTAAIDLETLTPRSPAMAFPDEGWFPSCAFEPKSQRLAVWRLGGIDIWDTEEGRPILRHGFDCDSNSYDWMWWSTDGQQLVALPHANPITVAIVESTSGPIVTCHETEMQDASCAAIDDAGTVVSLGSANGTWLLSRTSSGTTIMRATLPASVSTTRWVDSKHGFLAGTSEGTLYTAIPGGSPEALTELGRGIECIAPSAGDASVFVSCSDGTIKEVDLVDGKVVDHPSMRHPGLSQLRCLPDQGALVGISRSSTLFAWDLTTKDPLALNLDLTRLGADGVVKHPTFDTRGRLALLQAEDTDELLIDLVSGQAGRAPEFDGLDRYDLVGAHVVVTGEIRDRHTGEVLVRLPGSWARPVVSATEIAYDEPTGFVALVDIITRTGASPLPWGDEGPAALTETDAGRRLVVTSDRGPGMGSDSLVIDAETGDLLRHLALEGDSSNLRSIHLPSSGDWMAGANNSQLTTWSTVTGEQIGIAPTDDAVKVHGSDRLGSHLLVEDRAGLKLLATPELTVIATWPDMAARAGVVTTSGHIRTLDYQGLLWEYDLGEWTQIGETTADVLCAAFSTDGDAVCFASRVGVGVWVEGEGTDLFPTGGAPRPGAVQMDPSRRRVFLMGKGGDLAVFDTTSGRQVLTTPQTQTGTPATQSFQVTVIGDIVLLSSQRGARIYSADRDAARPIWRADVLWREAQDRARALMDRTGHLENARRLLAEDPTVAHGARGWTEVALDLWGQRSLRELHSEAWSLLASPHRHAEDHRRAAGLLREALRRAPDSTELNRTQAAVELRLGRASEAAAILARTESERPDPDDVTWRQDVATYVMEDALQAVAAGQLGRREEARRHLESALRWVRLERTWDTRFLWDPAAEPIRLGYNDALLQEARAAAGRSFHRLR